MKIGTIVKNAEKILRIDGEWNGETFWFDARTNAVSPAFIQQLKDTEKEPQLIAEALAGVLTDWEGADEFPPSAENLASLPMDFISYLLDKLTEVWQGNGQTPGASANGSAAAAK